MRAPRGSPTRFVHDRSGSAVVEFAIVAPVLLALVLGTIAFGSFLGVAHSLQAAASEAARAAIAGLDPAERAALATATAQRSVAISQLLRPDAVVIDARPDPNDPDLFVVTLRYDLKTTLLNLLPPAAPVPQTLSRSASIRRGGL
ncbi:TadE/TadG family type IV pilus assembly protein [Methylobacterium sp. EM32]|uniref:TadE/TadG family type IV pilus assembly protein n=1 Tax=Methylobacterium sp. EM32 TaxID=3163481 RepID=UPI0033B5186F